MIKAKAISLLKEHLLYYRINRDNSLQASKFNNRNILDIVNILKLIETMLTQNNVSSELLDSFYKYAINEFMWRYFKMTLHRDELLDLLKINMPQDFYETLLERINYDKPEEFSITKHEKVLNPKVSIIIPVYNVEKYIDDCSISIINQSLKEIEIIFVDDLGKDESTNIIKKYMEFDRKTVSHHEDVYVNYDVSKYKDITRNRWDIWENKPIENAAGLCYALRKIVNIDSSRQVALMEIVEKHPKAIIFYNFDYELDILKSLYYGDDVEIAEWNGHKHQPIPESDKWIYLVQYNAGAEGWNCIKTDTIIFYSQNYSYKVMVQSSGRIDRLNTPFTDLYYYHLKSRSGIDLAISRALKSKKKFNETRFVKQYSVTVENPFELPIRKVA